MEIYLVDTYIYCLLVKLLKSHMIDNLYTIIKENVKTQNHQERIQDGRSSLPLSICHPSITIISNLIGYPADLATVVTVCDFVLLSHAAANTFVSHSDEAFYFKQNYGLCYVVCVNICICLWDWILVLSGCIWIYISVCEIEYIHLTSNLL